MCNMKTKRVSIVVNEEYIDAFYKFWNGDENAHEELAFFCRGVYGWEIPEDADEEESEYELVKYLNWYGWNLGTHYIINK